MKTPPCRVCGKTEHVGCYPDDHAKTICVECCGGSEHDDGESGHQFDYHRSEGWTCRYCGVERSATAYDYSEDYA